MVNKKIKKLVIWGLKTVTAGFISIVLLSVFALVYKHTGLHIGIVSGATDYVWYPEQKMATMTEGFSWIQMDINGYNNVGQSDNIDNLVMGSSHMEAVNVASNKNAVYLLNTILPGYTYNIGISGHTIYRCVKNLDAAVEKYHPKNIIMETDHINLDIDEMRQVIDGTMATIPSYSSGILYYLQKYVPSVKVFYNQLDSWARKSSGDENSNDNIKQNRIEVEDGTDTNYTYVLNVFLDKAASSLSEEQHLLIVYQPRSEIDQNGAYISTADDEYAKFFQDACEKHGIDFLDMSEGFEELYSTKHMLAHGFINTAVGEGHMNEAGHRVFAEKVAAYIESKWEAR